MGQDRRQAGGAVRGAETPADCRDWPDGRSLWCSHMNPAQGGPEFSSFFKFATSIIRVFAVNEYICDYMVLDSKSCTQESYFYC